MNCKFCKKKCLNNNSLVQHQIRCNRNPDKIRTKHSEETKKKLSKVMKEVNTNSQRVWKTESIEKLRQSSKSFNKGYWTEENRKKHSDLMKKVVKQNPESYSTNNVSGRAKIYEYNGVKLKGTWEVRIATLLDKYNIKWTNDIKPIPYFWEEKWHLYFPDFYLIEYDKYIEVKGYERKRDISKWEAVEKPLIVLKQNDFEVLKKEESKIKEYIKFDYKSKYNCI